MFCHIIGSFSKENMHKAANCILKKETSFRKSAEKK